MYIIYCVHCDTQPLIFRFLLFMRLNNNCPLTAVLSVSNDSYSKFYLAYIGNIVCCDVIYDLIKAEAHVQNCKTPDWSDCLYLVGHMIIVCFE